MHLVMTAIWLAQYFAITFIGVSAAMSICMVHSWCQNISWIVNANQSSIDTWKHRYSPSLYDQNLFMHPFYLSFSAPNVLLFYFVSPSLQVLAAPRSTTSTTYAPLTIFWGVALR